MHPPAELDADVAYCTDQLRLGDRDRYLTTLLAPAGSRAALTVLYAFKLEVAKTHAVVSDPLLGQIRLQWWRESLDGVFAGSARRHAVLTPLAEVVAQRGLPRAPFDAIVDGHERDLDPTAFADATALEAYCAAVEGSLVVLAMAVVDEPPMGPRLELAERAGRAIGIAGLLRRMAQSRRRAGPLPIPLDIAAAHGLRPEAARTARPGDPELRGAVAAVAALAGRHLAAARSLRRSAHARDLFALLPLTVAGGTLKRLKAAGFDVSDGRVAEPAPGEAWRLMLASLRRRF